MKNLIIVVIAMTCLFAANRVIAIEPLTALQLKDACDDFREHGDSSAKSLCIYYVKGFLDGAVATDARVAENVVAEIEAEETFTDRAIRTRVGSRLKDFGPSVYAEFCVGQPDPIAELVLHVIEELGRYESLEKIQAQSVVYSSLRRHYPCTRD
ncbi:MAG: hypothetical protein K0U72_06425 [Gammaproteobacteria bacterium]|nr:hypothetical protein [Gammaproteobacteria bacterium]